MANAPFNQNYTLSGLVTLSVGVPNAGPYVVKGKISLPTVTDGGGASSVVAVVNLNGSPVYTGTAGAEGFRANLLCAAGDTVAVVLSSAAAPDNVLNAVKSTVEIYQGV